MKRDSQLTFCRSTACPRRILSAGFLAFAVSWAPCVLFGADATDGSPLILEEATLKARQAGENPFAAASVEGVLKSGTPAFLAPRSISVIPRELISEQKPTELHDLFFNVAGLSKENFNGDFNLRGFRVNGGPEDAGILYDGLRGHPGTFTFRPSLSNIERVEVLKGPSSILHGTLNPGGVLNLVSKRARPEISARVEGIVGSENRHGAEVDLTGPIDVEGVWQYRLVGEYQSFETEKDFHEIDRRLLQFGLGWQPRDTTRLDLIAFYTERDADGERVRGIPDLDGDFFALPDDFTFNEPEDFNDVRIFSFETLFEHAFSENLSFNAGFRYFDDEGDQEYHEPRGAEPTFADPVVERSFRDQIRDNEALQFQAFLSYDFATGPLRHSLTGGADWFQLETNSDFRRARGPQVPSLNVLDPVRDSPGKEGFTFFQNFKGAAERSLYGFFLRDEIVIGERDQWRLVGGARWDAFEDESSGESFGNPFEIVDDDSAVSLQGGALYQAEEDLALFGSYSESFVPQNLGTQSDPSTGGPFDPEEAWQVETGAKKTWLDGRFTSTLSLFHIVKENILSPDPNDPAGDRLIEVGEVRSRGIELEGFGQLSENWSVNFALSVQDIEITEATAGFGAEVGDPPAFSQPPDASGAFWLRYEAPDAGFWLAGGPEWIAERDNPASSSPGDDENIPSFVVFNLAGGYKHANGTYAQLNINNVFDEEHSFGGFGNRWGFERGESVNAQLRAGWRF